MKLKILMMLAVYCSVVFSAHANPVCVNPGISDPDGDGWGWENGQSCIVESSTSNNVSTNTGNTSSESELQRIVADLQRRVTALENKLATPEQVQQVTTSGGYSNQTPSCQQAADRIIANALSLRGKTMDQVRELIGKPQHVETRASSYQVTTEWWWSRYQGYVGVTFTNNNVSSFRSDADQSSLGC